MKVKVISRSEDEFTRERSRDLQRVFRNYDPSLHPQEKAVEYVRALNAAKLDKFRYLQKPFIGAMDGHIDAISCMAKNPKTLERDLFRINGWRYSTMGYSLQTVCQFPGHNGAVRGLTVSTDGKVLVSCGNDCTIRLWRVPVASSVESYTKPEKAMEPISVYVWKNAFRGVDHQWDGSLFATVGAQVDIWDQNRSEPISSFAWGSDTVVSVRFNPAHQNLLGTSASDRSITLYDLRTSTPLKKIIMQTRTNALSWNPREPMNFTAANEDCNCYSYDMRKLEEAKCVHKDHVSAVMDIDYSPTGREFVTGSYDRTSILCKVQLRCFLCLSGSDDTNVRLWKANASEQLGVLLPRERKKQEYQDAVVDRYKHLPEIKRIVRHRHLPKPIFKAATLRRTITDAEKRREDRRKAHSAPGSVVTVPLRKRKIVASVE